MTQVNTWVIFSIYGYSGDAEPKKNAQHSSSSFERSENEVVQVPSSASSIDNLRVTAPYHCLFAEKKLYCKSPYYWKSGNTAELDFIYENNENVVPVEVKAATNTQAKSYKQFSKKYGPKVGFKASLKNIVSNMINETNTINIPLYLLWNIDYYG